MSTVLLGTDSAADKLRSMGSVSKKSTSMMFPSGSDSRGSGRSHHAEGGRPGYDNGGSAGWPHNDGGIVGNNPATWGPMNQPNGYNSQNPAGYHSEGETVKNSRLTGTLAQRREQRRKMIENGETPHKFGDRIKTAGKAVRRGIVAALTPEERAEHKFGDRIRAKRAARRDESQGEQQASPKKRNFLDKVNRGLETVSGAAKKAKGVYDTVSNIPGVSDIAKAGKKAVQGTETYKKAANSSLGKKVQKGYDTGKSMYDKYGESAKSAAGAISEMRRSRKEKPDYDDEE